MLYIQQLVTLHLSLYCVVSYLSPYQ